MQIRVVALGTLVEDGHSRNGEMGGAVIDLEPKLCELFTRNTGEIIPGGQVSFLSKSE